MVFNFPEFERVGDKIAILTRLEFPAWCRGLALRQSIRSFRIRDFEVSEISSKFDLRGLAEPDEEEGILERIRNRLGRWLDPKEVHSVLAEIHPIDGKEIVEWMHISVAEAMTMRARIQEYNRAGIASYATGNATDPRYPGLVVDDIRMQSDSGYTVRSRGYGITITPRGNYNVPFLGKATGIFRDHLSWGSCSSAGGIQWTASLLKWRRLAETPIRERIGFYMDFRGNTAPNFFAQIPTLPKPRATLVMRFSSDRDQNITLRFRDPTNYTRVIGEKIVRVPSGSAEVTTTVSGFPYVPPTTSEIQPADGAQTTLDLYVVE